MLFHLVFQRSIYFCIFFFFFKSNRNLADTDRDGKMNINEFSIACKLVNLKLRGFEIPKQLPPTMIASLTAVGSTPTLTPTGAGSLSPVTNLPPGKFIAAPKVNQC